MDWVWSRFFSIPNVRIDMAMAQVTAMAQSAIRSDPPGTYPPFIIVYNASSVPILQLALSGKNLSEQQLFDLGVKFSPGATWRPCRALSCRIPTEESSARLQVDLNMQALQAKGLSPNDVVNAISTQNLILPAGTVKIGIAGKRC